LRYVLGATLAAGAVGLLAGTIAGIVGSPVMVRFPTAQKRLALLVIIGGVIPAIIMAALPQQDTFFHSSMARAYYNRQIYPLATRHFEKAYQLDPFDVSVNSDLAVCYEKIGAHTAVLDHLQRAVDLDQLNRKRDPNYEPVPETYKNLAVAYYRDGGLLGDEKLIAAAAELFAEYIHVITQELPAEKKRDPEIDTFYDLINAYIALNQPDKALSAAEQAASFYPDDSKLQEQVAQLRKVVSQEPSEQPSASPSATRPSSPSGGTSEPEKPGAETTRGEEAAAAGSEEKEGRGEEKTETPSPE
jgi:tetratricopeptide (TPR) repeat protein